MTVRVDRHDDVAVITLDRPGALNALDAAMLDSLARAIDAAAAGPVSALVITGAGGKAFCAGADIAELRARDVASQRAASAAGQAIFAKLDGVPFPSLAVIDGLALGGGLELALACTFRLATPASRFGLPEIRLGLIPGYGGTQRLPRLIGEARAIDWIASGRVVEADEALRAGLLNRVERFDDPVTAGLAFLASMRPPGERWPAALAMARAAVARAADLPLAAGLAFEAEQFGRVVQTADATEGVAAFLDRRLPRFIGR